MFIGYTTEVNLVRVRDNPTKKQHSVLAMLKQAKFPLHAVSHTDRGGVHIGNNTSAVSILVSARLGFVRFQKINSLLVDTMECTFLVIPVMGTKEILSLLKKVFRCRKIRQNLNNYTIGFENGRFQPTLYNIPLDTRCAARSRRPSDRSDSSQ